MAQITDKQMNETIAEQFLRALALNGLEPISQAANPSRRTVGWVYATRRHYWAGEPFEWLEIEVHAPGVVHFAQGGDGLRDAIVPGSFAFAEEPMNYTFSVSPEDEQWAVALGAVLR